MAKDTILDNIIAEYSAKRNLKEKQIADNYAKLIDICPEFKEVRTKHAKAMAKSIKDSINGSKNDLNSAHKEYNDNLKKYCKISGMDIRDFEIEFDCKICMDTGYVGENKKEYCVCVKNKAAKLTIESNNNDSECTFSSFDINIFPDKDEIDKKGRTQKKFMEDLRDFMINYCNEFPQNVKKQILLTGTTGVGKSFIANCAGNYLADKGYNVVNTTASGINEAALNILRNNDYKVLNMMKNAEMLIIDDLGIELMKKNLTAETLYEIIEHRLRQKLHIIVCTNLIPAQIEERYGHRVQSRLMSAKLTIGVNINGKDLRSF